MSQEIIISNKPADRSLDENSGIKSKLDGFLYEVNEVVLCYHGPLLYEAKILKCEFFDEKKLAKLKAPTKGKSSQLLTQKGQDEQSIPGPRYFIHYKGWKSRWDEWVTASRIEKWNDENLAKRDELAQDSTNKQPKSQPMSNPAATISRKPSKSAISSQPQVSLPVISQPTHTTPKGVRKQIPELPEIRSKRIIHAKSLERPNYKESPISDADLGDNRFSEQDDSFDEEKFMRENLKVDPETGKPLEPIANSTEPAKDYEPNQNKRKSESELEVTDNLMDNDFVEFQGPPIDLDIPESLKFYLVGQWEQITKGQMLIPLPRSPTIRDILRMYKEYAIRNFQPKDFIFPAELENHDFKSYYPKHYLNDLEDSLDGSSKSDETKREMRSPYLEDVVQEIVDGLALYFTKTLGSFLLYRFERHQYLDLLTQYPKARPPPPKEKKEMNPDEMDLENNGKEVLFEETKGKDASAAASSPGSKSTSRSSSNGNKRVKTDPNYRITQAKGDKEDCDKDLLDLYGAEHLIRLFAHLPTLLSHAHLLPEGAHLIKVHLNHLITFLAERRDQFFVQEYDTAPPSYLHLLRSE